MSMGNLYISNQTILVGIMSGRAPKDGKGESGEELLILNTSMISIVHSSTLILLV